MPIDLNALAPSSRALWAKIMTTALAAGEADSDAEAIAEKGLANVGAVSPTTPLVTADGGVLKLRVPVTAVLKGPKGTLDVFGWGSVAVDDAGRVVVDHQSDIIEAKELETAVYNFAKQLGTVDVQHDREPVGQLIESAFFDPRKRVAMGLDGTGRVGWWAGFRISDPAAIEAVKSGDLPEFSIDAMAVRDVLAEDQITKSKITKAQAIGRLRQIKLNSLSLVTAGAGKGVTVQLWKGLTMDKPEDPKPEDALKALGLDQIKAAIAALSPEDKSALIASLEPKAPAGDAAAEGHDTPAAKALAEVAKAREVELEKANVELAKFREAAEIQKAREDGLDGLPGAKLEAIVKSLRAAPDLRPVLVLVAKALKESALMKSIGTTPAPGADDSVTYEALYEAEKKKNPTENPAAIASRLAKAHPDLYAAHRARS